MRRIAFLAGVVVFLAGLALVTQAQEQSAPLNTLPAAVRFQSECTGFIASPALPRDIYVVGGEDDETQSPVRQFVEPNSIFITGEKGGDIKVGSEFRVIRPANELFRTRRYQGQSGDIRRAGQPYQDVAIVKVTHLNPEGAVALITFSCETVFADDILIPFQPRPVPTYTVNKPLDHFAPLDKTRQRGKIVGGRNNSGYLGNDHVVYLNLGEGQGVVPGQRYRIYKDLPPHPTGFLTSKPVPPETLGEAVVLTVQSKSCVAMVVAAYRQISTGDSVEAE